ncbi:MAG TPA: hypothetical protein VMV10_16390 [Pirellulales bacterium]|nr:hypothetical protein [Pirellulales bacterium]
MWEMLVIGGALAGGYKLAKAIKGNSDRARAQRAAQDAARQSRERAVTATRCRQAQAEVAKRQAARDMQLAIQQLSQSPDFRRAASFAARANEAGVPAAFRQRQFRRLRSLLIEHLARRIQAGAALESAASGLRELVGGLGVAAYEADYIATEAQGRQGTPTQSAEPNYRDRLRHLHGEHAQRLEAIRSTADLEEELREQLVEAEQERFRRELLEQPDEGR